MHQPLAGTECSPLSVRSVGRWVSGTEPPTAPLALVAEHRALAQVVTSRVRVLAALAGLVARREGSQEPDSQSRTEARLAAVAERSPLATPPIRAVQGAASDAVQARTAVRESA